MSQTSSLRYRGASTIAGTVLLLSSLVSPLVGQAPAQAATAATSPDNRIVVVTANLREAWTPEDVADISDMQIFAGRVLAQTPYAPDALLLQEVSRTAAKNVASILSNRTGYTYTVAKAKKRTRKETRSAKHLWANAILLNATTMQKLDNGGFIATGYSRDDSAGGVKPTVANSAYTFAGERGGGLKIALSSSHLAQQHQLKTERIANTYKKKWSEKIATKLKRAYGGYSSNRITSIGGDFNTQKCSGGYPCHPLPFWRTLTSDGYGYRDTIHETVNIGGVDYIFTSGGVINANLDSTYSDPKPSSRGFYSDHRFRWAVVSNDVTRPTAPTALRATTGKDAIVLSWTAARDAGSGIDHYEVWRSGVHDWSPRMTGRTKLTRFVNSNVYRHKKYRYFVVAVDRSHNKHRSKIVKIEAL
jgi:hypothetical protein